MARPRLHDDALRTRLLDATSEVISRRGEAAVTVRSVAADAGTSPSAVYALFGSRDDLVAAVSAEGYRRFAAHLSAVPTTDDPGADLAGLGRAYREFALGEPHFYAVMFARAIRQGADAPEAVEQTTFLVLRDAVARLLPDAAPAVVGQVAFGLWGLVHGMAGLELAGLAPGGRAEADARFDAALGAVGRGLVDGLLGRVPTPGRAR
ncbi:TetR/AcrR family transcriptional regulator [Oerskovia flava]|uniref:TetR/AcrR family transcriptional regulator n=1 Tax=Oerskovia flava TaxID=2986422 RepID=UPI00223FB72D|nr:TetR/AcrR family transcriptional regulator [Oerskovia sp. JB1-3-2]